MEDDRRLQGEEAKGSSIWNLFDRKRFAARKSAPMIAPPAFNASADDDDGSEYELSEPGENKCYNSMRQEADGTAEESNGTRDPPSRQLLQESRMDPTVPDDELVSKPARPSQLSSPAKSVHFSDEVVDTAQESANLLQKARSPRNASIQSSHPTRRPSGKLKKPTIIASGRYNGKTDDPIQPYGRLEPDRPRNSSAESHKRDDIRKRSTLSNNDQMAESEQSLVRRKSKNSQSASSAKGSSRNKWSKEDCLKVAVLRDERIPREDIQKVPVRGEQKQL
jgi:hypothetical protein